jgi:hypothetical protein
MEEMKRKSGSSCESGACEKKKLVCGIVCDVKNCAYHDKESECYAGKVSIGPREASCSANTVCATFKPREF